MKGKRRSREDYRRGLPGYHDPMAGVAGAPVALSALTLRLWLAGFGVVFFVVAAVLVFLFTSPTLLWLAWVLVVLAILAGVNVSWVAYRKWRGEPG